MDHACVGLVEFRQLAQQLANVYFGLVLLDSLLDRIEIVRLLQILQRKLLGCLSGPFLVHDADSRVIMRLDTCFHPCD
jgi:hypothetical protein